MINKRFISLLTAVSMCIPMVTALQTVLPTAPTAEAAAVSSPAPDHEVRVVAKRITGDDTYLEISLEVDRDYEEYTAVGVVLEYDATKIVPAASWDDGAVEADMSANTSWATRRALPTLGKDTWTSHTALAYQTQKVDTTDPSGTAMIPDKGYLYLGAEYPGTIPDPYDPTVTPDPSASPTTAPAAPTAAPTLDPSVTPDPDIYVNPIVVARFMYVGADATAKKATKTAIEGVWTTPAPVPDGTSWDEDWLGKDGMGDYFTVASSAKNEILHIADDAISARSTAEYGAAVYFSDYSRKVFRYTFPTPAPTATPTPTPAAGATAAPQPFSTYAPAAVGSAVTTAEQMNAGEIEIVLGEGKSAKSGGLSLSDIYVTVFYDWDDSIIGTLTCGAGVDSSEDVNNYVKEKMIHPNLRGNTNYSSKKRVDNYRGEYPSAGPNSTNPTLPGGTDCYPDVTPAPGTTPAPGAVDMQGSSYPLTNKLEYCFGGRDFNTDGSGNALPYTGGWTLVDPAKLSDTWTSLSTADNFAQTVDLDGDGNPDMDPTSTYLVDASGNKIDMVSYNLADLPTVAKDIDGGVLSLKAVYVPGDDLDKNYIVYYTAIGPIVYDKILPAATTAETIFSASFEFRRINELGCGVSRLRDIALKMDITQQNAKNSSPLRVDVVNKDVIPVMLTPSGAVSILEYQLKETYGSDLVNGGDRSYANGIDGAPIKLGGADGVFFSFTASSYLEKAKKLFDDNTNITNAKAWAAADFTALSLTSATGAALSSATNRKNATKALQKLVGEAISAGQDYKTITWYQMQYAVAKNSAPYYKSPADAKTEITTNYPVLLNNIAE